MHSISVTGRLTRDPEQRYTPDGKAVTTFTVADNGDRSGAVFFRVTAWGRLAEVCAEYLEKGRTVALVGRLKGENGGPRVWTAQDGQPRASFEVTAANVEFLSSDPQGERAQEPPQERGPAQEEIPF